MSQVLDMFHGATALNFADAWEYDRDKVCLAIPVLHSIVL